MSTIRPEALDERLDDVVVLDIRPRERYERRHIEGAKNVPVYDELRAGDEQAIERVADAAPEDAEVVTVCKMGVVARRATSHLAAEGHDATTLSGGMRAWRGYRDGTLLYRLWRLLAGLVP